ncbi:MAG: YdcH family protein [Hyphomonadaceae bacterium]|nr:YdcH family protein [Hyphomonadaceae bacterium]
MSLQGRIEELSHRHRQLDETIQTEQKRPATDTLKLKDLKRQKLRIKEELQHLQEH